MSRFEAQLKIIGEDNCPIYKMGDVFRLSRNLLFSQQRKPACIILTNDILEVWLKYGKEDADQRYVFNCSECTGRVRVEYIHKKEEKATDAAKIRDVDEADLAGMAGMLSQFSLFKSLDKNSVEEIISFLRMKRFNPGDIIIRKGEQGRHLYIMVSGRVDVVGDGHISIASLGKGEVFGEMSLISGSVVAATIKVMEPTTVLYLDGDDFKRVLSHYPSLQMYLAILLAQRLAKTNITISEQLSSGMIGKLAEIPPMALFQTLNLNQKTGMLNFELSLGNGEVGFNNGEIIYARYAENEGKEAVFRIMQETDGRFTFNPGLPPEYLGLKAIGGFMGILMAGAQIIDEADDAPEEDAGENDDG
jgi:CRP/FNR family transcriptional regulator, cyclic AMP receptor protein